MKDIIIDALVDLYQNGPRVPHMGICSHVDNYMDNLPRTQLLALSTSGEVGECYAEAEYLMEELFQEWPEFSGSWTFPVPCPKGQALSAAFNGSDMWSGEYGEKRWSLAEFLLRELCK